MGRTDRGARNPTSGSIALAWSVGLCAEFKCPPEPIANGRANPTYMLRPLALVLPVLHQVIDHAGISERRGVAERAVIVLGDLAQDAAHDLARAGLGQPGRELDEVGRGDRADLLAHPVD